MGASAVASEFCELGQFGIVYIRPKYQAKPL